MSAVTRPRGPLPARVYWTRRLLVLGLALALVFGIGRLLGGGSDAKSSGDGAVLSGAGTNPGDTQTGPSHPRSTAKGGKGTKGTKQPKPSPSVTPLAQPDGPCTPAEVLVTPKITNAVAGREVLLRLELTSTQSEACTWRVSSDTIAVKITSGKDFIWSSQQCPRSVTAQDVIVRKPGVGTPVAAVVVRWSGRRSDEDCARTTDYVRPGYYHALAATLGGTATDQQFELTYPTRPTITVTVTPKQKARQKG